MFNYSPNMLKTFCSCPKKFEMKYIHNINAPVSSVPFEKGKKIHALANYYLRGINIARIETALTEEEKNIWSLLQNNEYYSKDYFNSEFPLSIRVGDFWISGRIDAIVHSGKDYYILDYKTGSTPSDPEYDFQTMVYLLAMDKYLEDYDNLYFVYINLKTQKDYVIKFDENLKSQYSEKLTEICKKIEKTTVFKQDFSQCKYCEYSKFCKF